jgi:hypothetical protein
MQQQTINFLSGAAVGAAGVLAGAVLSDRLSRQRVGRQYQSADAKPLPTQIAEALRDKTYDVEWEVRGPVQLSARDTTVALHGKTP